MAKTDQILLSAGLRNPDKIKAAFSLLIKTGLRMLQADEGSLLVYRKEHSDLQFVSTIGGSSPTPLQGLTVPIGRGITGMAAMTCEIQTASRASGSDFFDIADDGAPNSVIAAPILIDDELIGVITAVSFKRDKTFSTEDCQNFSLLASLGGIIITQEQQLASYASKKIKNLTEQSAQELKAAELAVTLLRKHPHNSEAVLQTLTQLNEL